MKLITNISRVTIGHEGLVICYANAVLIEHDRVRGFGTSGSMPIFSVASSYVSEFTQQLYEEIPLNIWSMTVDGVEFSLSICNRDYPLCVQEFPEPDEDRGIYEVVWERLRESVYSYWDSPNISRLEWDAHRPREVVR